jgi:hypothetical protein
MFFISSSLVSNTGLFFLTVYIFFYWMQGIGMGFYLLNSDKMVQGSDASAAFSINSTEAR